MHHGQQRRQPQSHSASHAHNNGSHATGIACCCEGGVSPERGLPSITGDADGDAGFYAGFMMLHMLDCSPPYTGFAFALLAANTR